MPVRELKTNRHKKNASFMQSTFIYARVMHGLCKNLVTSVDNKARVRQAMIDRADEGEFRGMYMALGTDEPTRDAFPQ